MTCSTVLTVVQGKTFARVLRWEMLPFVYTAIQSISQVAPVSIQSNGHGLVNGWRAAVVSVRGMIEINAKKSPPVATDFHKVTVVDANTIEFNDVNAADFTEHEANTGYLQSYTAQDLDGYSARFKIKDMVGGDVLLELDSDDGIEIDNDAKTITLTISAAQTAALTPRTGAVFELEMESASGVVTTLLRGEMNIIEEVTD